MSRGLTESEHVALSGFLSRHAGLVFEGSRRTALAAIVAERLRESGAADLGAYLARISAPDGAEERQRLIDEVTVPETHFFRNPPQMEALRTRVLPELMRRAVARRRPLTIWSAGCSTGEEPYSLAILAAEVAADLDEAPDIRVLATDVSSRAVEATIRARYQGRSIALVDQTRLSTWFEPERDGVYTVVPEIRELVEVRAHNLVTDGLPVATGEVDLLVCRNVTIYFARDTTRDLLGRFHDALGAGGYLVVGHAETLWQLSDSFTLVPIGDAFVHRKDVAAVRVPDEEYVVIPRHAPRRPVTAHMRSERLRGVLEPVDSVPDPDHATMLLGQARVALGRTRYAEAARLAAAASAASPFEIEAYVVEGRARATAGDDAGALIALRKAVYLAPHAGHARFQLAAALARCGEPGAAAREYRAAAEVLPTTSSLDLMDLLDGCDVDELISLCHRLADECDVRVGELL